MLTKVPGRRTIFYIERTDVLLEYGELHDMSYRYPSETVLACDAKQVRTLIIMADDCRRAQV